MALIITAGAVRSKQLNKVREPEDLIRRSAIFTCAHPPTAIWDLLDCSQIGERKKGEMGVGAL